RVPCRDLCHAAGAEPESRASVGDQGSAADAVDLQTAGGSETILHALVRMGGPIAARAGEAGRRHAPASSRWRASIRETSDNKRRGRRAEQQNHEHQAQGRWLPQPLELYNRDLFPLRRPGPIPTLIPDGSELLTRHFPAQLFEEIQNQNDPIFLAPVVRV